jgi:DeoR family suf operon transcriptional repressor
MRLLMKQELSAQSLAATLGVSPAAVRQHLDTLEARGLVGRRKLVTKPSRPTYLYRLSARGTETFPKRYDLLLTLITGVIRDRDGDTAITQILQAAAERLALAVRAQFEGTDTARRWEFLVEWLETEFAWHADVAVDRTGLRRITIHQCPFEAVARQQPVVCAVFFPTLIRVLARRVDVERIPITDGVACCSLLVDLKTA